jgi:hypothetical protein
VSPPGCKSILLLGLLLTTFGAQARLSVQTDAQSIHETDSIEIQVTATGMNRDAPDFGPIEQDFEILSSRSNSQYRSVNGRVDAWTRWTLNVKPKRAGRLTIPALELDGQRSQPVTVEVKPLDAEVRAAIDALVFFELEVTPEPVYVQAQLVLARRLFYADGAQLYGDMPAAPEISDAIVETLGQASSTTAIRNGRRYGVIEQHYAVFPERSGTLTIPAVSVSGSVRLPLEFDMRRRTGVRVQSEIRQVTVLPIPPGYPATAPWLPARRVELVEAWDAGPELVLGTPVERTLIVRAEGTVASIIPPLEVVLPEAIRGYPDPPNLRDSFITSGAQGAQGLVGTRTESMSLVPGSPGPQRLPPVTLTWFDTASEVVREARIDARSLQVSGQVIVDDAPASVGSTGQPKPLLDPSTTPRIPPSPRADRASSASSANDLLMILLGLAAIGWLYTGWRLRQSRRPSAVNTAPERKDLTERAAFRTLESAARHTASVPRLDARKIKDALALWAGAYYGSPPDRALTMLNAADPESGSIIDGLNASLYAADSQANTEVANLASLAAAAVALATRIRTSNSTATVSPLGPLYPSAS